MKRILSFLLALMLLFGTACFASASAVPEQAAENSTETLPVETVKTLVIPALLSGSEYLDEDAAAQYLSQQLQARKDTVVVKVRSQASVNEVANVVLEKAFAHTGEPTGGDYVHWHLNKLSVGISYWPTRKEYTLTYAPEYHTTAQQERELDEAVDALLEQLELWEKSDYEKVLGIYDYMTRNITYDYANLNDADYALKYTAYGALMNKTAVCQGYANLFYRLALELGVDCRIISGIGNGGGHAWNIVKLGGRYYDLDATWDASAVQAGLPYKYFLRCEENFEDHTRHEEYETEQFHEAYPMSTEDYDPAVVRCGDADGDGTVSGMDATLLLQYAAGWSVQIDGPAADVNGDGVVDGMDATLLLQYAAGWDVSLSAA